MGSISIGLKRKPKGKVAVFDWGDDNMVFVGENLESATTTIETVEKFCEKYTNKKVAELELKRYQEGGFKYVLDTRRFHFARTKHEARQRATHY